MAHNDLSKRGGEALEPLHSKKPDHNPMISPFETEFPFVKLDKETMFFAFPKDLPLVEQRWHIWLAWSMPKNVVYMREWERWNRVCWSHVVQTVVLSVVGKIIYR
jgi:hypothetical protein